MVLPRIPKYVVKCVDNRIREFLWNKKKAKIALSILQNPKNQGGLNLVNLEKKDIALKATWPQILYKEKDYATVVYKIMRCSCIGEDIWRCSIQPEDVPLLKIQNQFWQDVLKSWSEFNAYKNTRIENQLIWYNSCVRIAGKPFMWNDTYNRGLRYTYQLFENMEFKSQEQVAQEYGLTKMRYNSLKMALPKEWKDYFQQHNTQTFFPIPPHNFDTYTQGEKGGLSREVYSFIAEDALLIHNKYMKWRQELGSDFDLTLCEYAKEHQCLYSVTNVTKYRSFQYRILQRGLVTNIQLYKWNILSNNLCTFCHSHPENMTHLFWECHKVKTLWENLKSYMELRFKKFNLIFNCATIIFNRVDLTKTSSVINFLVLVTKQFIYRQRCQQKDINFPILKQIIMQIENVEKYIAVKNNRVQRHNAKWQSG